MSALLSPIEARCIRCGREIFDEEAFCAECLGRLSPNDGKRCPRCGAALDKSATYCANCVRDKLYYDGIYAPFIYEGEFREVMRDFKFHRFAAAARVLARYLVREAERADLEYDMVTFVPMHEKALRVRKYNQSQLLAEEFCDILKRTDLFADTLYKVRHTAKQDSLSRSERRKNLKGCFALKAGAEVKGRKILLIDDIKTTGATLNECAKVLKRHGALRVTGLTLAVGRVSVRFYGEEEEQ